jgi:hypothetical protein
MKRNMFFTLCLILCVQLVPALAFGQARTTSGQNRRTPPATRATPPRIDIPYERFVLKNGITSALKMKNPARPASRTFLNT